MCIFHFVVVVLVESFSVGLGGRGDSKQTGGISYEKGVTATYVKKETSLIPRLIPIFGWSTVFSGFFGLLINQKRFLLRLFLKHLVKTVKRHVFRFREAKAIFLYISLCRCCFGSVFFGRVGVVIPNKQVESVLKMSVTTFYLEKQTSLILRPIPTFLLKINIIQHILKMYILQYLC